MPKVSVCIPVYNQRPEYLRECVASALQQQFDSFEVIVSENHSSNGCERVLEEFRDPRLRVVRPPQHLVLPANFNFCVQHAGGQYLSILGSDDRLMPGYCARLSQVLDEHPEAGFASCGFYAIGAAGEILALVNDACARFEVRSGNEELPRYVFGPVSNFVAGMMRLELYRTVGGLVPELDHVSDWDIFLKFLARAGVVHIPEPYVCYRAWDRPIAAERLVSRARLIRTVYEEHERAGTFASLPPGLLQRAKRNWAVVLLAADLPPQGRAEVAHQAVLLDSSPGVRARAFLVRHGAGVLVRLWRDLRIKAGAVKQGMRRATGAPATAAPTLRRS